MKIIFICGSLEPGRDGVGDYTRKFATELNRQGHLAGIIALNDKDAESDLTGAKQQGYNALNILRLPSNINFATRTQQAGIWIDKFDPEWISLQFVPFSFHKKGLPVGLGRFIKAQAKKRKLHIMVHELWVGRTKTSLWKTRILSFTQQIHIKALLKNLQPTCVHTHLPVYKQSLNEIGLAAKELPLFSNINIEPHTLYKKPDNIFRLAFFSQVAATKQILDFINDFSFKLNEKGLIAELILIGGNKNKMIKFVDTFKIACKQLFDVSYTGFLDEPDISRSIAHCNLGITPLPVHALGKSGSVAAFIAHGLPVAAPLIQNEYSEFGIGFFDPAFRSAIMVKPDFELFKNASYSSKAVSHNVQVLSVVNTFLKDISVER